MADELEKSKQLQKYAGLTYGASSLSSLAGGFIDYSLLKTENMFLGVQADEIELRAQEQANMLREQFIGDIGSATYGATKRGIKATSGSVMANIKESSKELGEDIESLKTSARLKASSLRASAKVRKGVGKAKLGFDIASSLSSGAASYSLLKGLKK